MRKETGEAGRHADLLQYLIDAQAKERADGDGETGDEYQDMTSGNRLTKLLRARRSFSWRELVICQLV